MKNTVKITGRYLWFPIKPGKQSDTAISIYIEEEKLLELYISISEDEPDFYGWFDANSYMGRLLNIEGDYKEAWFQKLIVSDEKPCNPTKNRPLIHYASSFGWLNDPNGLIYHNGTFHIYHQHNPYGVKWENIHWGYTQTTDFIHYMPTEDVLIPDKEGPIFSGTAIEDKKNCLGFGKHAIAYFYTSAGGRSQWSSGYSFTQKVAVSTDNGKTLKKLNVIIPHIDKENRDPKVFYHEESNSYIMVLYITNDTVYFFRSNDLLHWDKMQEIQVPGMRECPDFFSVTCEEDGVKKWVLWSADGYYCLGTFDGKVFKPDEYLDNKAIKKHQLYDLLPDIDYHNDRQFPRAYAAQTFQGVDDRILQLSWITSVKENKNYAGMLSLPAELCLNKRNAGYRLSIHPAKEMKNLRKETFVTTLEERVNKNLYSGNDHAIEIEINMKAIESSYLKMSIFQTELEIDMREYELRVGTYRIKLSKDSDIDMRIFADTDIFEIFVMNGQSYVVVNNESDSLNGTVDMQTLNVEGEVKLHVLQSMQFENENS